MGKDTVELPWPRLPPTSAASEVGSAALEAVISFLTTRKGMGTLREQGRGSGKVINVHRFADNTTSERLGRDHPRPPTSRRQRGHFSCLNTQ